MDNFINKLLRNIDIKHLIARGIIPSSVSIPLTTAQKEAAHTIKTKLDNNKDFDDKDILALTPYMEAIILYV